MPPHPVVELRLKAEQGDASAQYDLGFICANGEGVALDYGEAANWYRKAADRGHACAQSKLGTLYDHGKGVKQDHAEAAKWYRMAADQGFPEAQFRLGTLYTGGYQGVEQDYGEALSWLRKSAEQGHSGAQHNLGNLYYFGRGVPQDREEGIKLYHLAAQASSEDAISAYQLSRVYFDMQDYKQSAEWLRKSADQEFVTAQYKLGDRYYSGQGVTQDYSEAAKWYRKACEKGLPIAGYKLGLLHLDGRGVEQDFEEAYFWLICSTKIDDDEIQTAIPSLLERAQLPLTPEQVSAVQKRALEWKPTGGNGKRFFY